MEITWRIISGKREGREQGEKVQEIRSINCLQNRQGEVKNCIGNGEAKELICMTHGHELKGWNAGGRGDTRWRGIKRGMGQL